MFLSAPGPAVGTDDQPSAPIRRRCAPDYRSMANTLSDAARAAITRSVAPDRLCAADSRGGPRGAGCRTASSVRPRAGCGQVTQAVAGEGPGVLLGLLVAV